MTWHRTSRHSRGYGTAWDKLRKTILERDKHLCQPCLANGRPTPATQVDHVTPKAKGGTDAADNLQGICAPCHDLKTAQDAADAQGRAYRPKVAFGADGWPA